jgi:hypothetical protein
MISVTMRVRTISRMKMMMILMARRKMISRT